MVTSEVNRKSRYGAGEVNNRKAPLRCGEVQNRKAPLRGRTEMALITRLV